MPKVEVNATGVLVVDGEPIFPIGFSEPPPIGAEASNGRPALEELAKNGGNFIRTGPREFGDLSAPTFRPQWNHDQLPAQVAKVMQRFDEAKTHGLYCWLFLSNAADVTGPPGSPSELLLGAVVDAFKGHSQLLAYKGCDEPNNNPTAKPPQMLERAFTTIKNHDPDHPVVIIEAPVGDLNGVLKYGKTFDITGVDVFPVEYPRPFNPPQPKPLTIVGDWTSTMVQAASQSQSKKPAVWTTLQIAGSGTAASDSKPDVIPTFPSLPDERFMAYLSIVRGARGLTFFGGHMTQVCTPDDAKLGWNWSFWRQVLRPVVHQLGGEDMQAALTAPNAPDQIKTRIPVTHASTDVELVARRANGFLYVIAVRTGSSGVMWIEFTGLPAALTRGEVLFEYVRQDPPPPFNPPQQIPRPVKVANGAFQDIFRPRDVHLYRFKLS